MARITSGTFHVFTFKDGLLARMAHDLRLSLERFEVEHDGDQVKGTFWPSSLKIDGALKGGQLQPGELSDGDKAKIHDNITGKILMTGRHPEVTFEGTGQPDGADAWRLQGTLTLMGKALPVSLRVVLKDGHYQGEVELTPTRWGIAPYKALGGAIKLQDRLKIAFKLPAA